MGKAESQMEKIGRLLDVPSTDPQDARRRKLLNILLLGVAVSAFIGTVLTLALPKQGGGAFFVYLYLGTLSLVAVIYVVNRLGKGWLASLLFLLALLVVVSFADEPGEVADGRTLVTFAPLIVMGSVILPPYASFLVAGFSSLAIAGLALSVGITPNPLAMVVFFVIGLVSWLSARTLERALDDLRAINTELDQRVEARTRELAEVLSRNRAVLEGIADGVVVFDTSGIATAANPASGELLGRPAGQIVGHNIESLMGNDVSNTDRQVIVDLLASSERRYPIIKVDWGRRTLSVSFAPVRDNGDQMTGTVAVFRDFTREAELERMKTAFVSIVSHELRTPLTSILGYADMLQEGSYGPLTEEQMDPVRRIVANAERQTSLVNDLLDQAQIEAGTLSLSYTIVSPADLIADLQSTMGVLAEGKGLKLTSEIAGDVPARLPGDRQRLGQILINLATNAIKFTDEGSVHISVYRHNETHWALAVTDTGPGIPEEARSTIFEPFRQLDSSATRRHGGVGLGLSIVKQLTTLMGGEISLESEVGRGSTFTIRLPVNPFAGMEERWT